MKFFKHKTDEEKEDNTVEPEQYEFKTETGKKANNWLTGLIDKICMPRDGKFPYMQILDWKHNRVGLHVMKYDNVNEWFTDDYTHVPKKDLPKMAVHMSRTRKEWFLDETGLGRYPDAHELTAVFSEAWRRNNYINEALSQNWKGQVDTKLLLLVAIVGVVGAVVCMAIFGMI